ncbi:DUF3685 domain-containing protein [Crocosphaera chwakensis]|uniref:Response regulatory domain-containing protein n=1 Tax=Crocosphaera chwakensis CCY0110 TaxID=391612 RepID=A3IKL6_9CHRO|nr:DUF3685 domain-containing protein [Crocosphaera chwakensis]EAZ93205.1 hypothetical protein CY0110_04014 [Crocosphaera chwakensis CCY0110]
MSDRRISLLFVDQDAIFRLGLATILSNYPQWEIVSQTDNLTDALTQLSSNTVDLITLDPNLRGQTLTVEAFYQQIKEISPETKICLLSYALSWQQQQDFREIGIEGYCHKGEFIDVLLENWQKIIEGEIVWPVISSSQLSEFNQTISKKNWLSKVRKSGIEEINKNLQLINKNLKNYPSSTWDKIFWQGRKRELLTARWLVEQLLPVDVIVVASPRINSQIMKTNNLSSIGTLVATGEWLNLFQETNDKLENNLKNLTNFLLEIDILKSEKKREILELVLKQFERIISDFKFIETKSMQISRNRLSVLERLWRESALIFLSKYCLNEKQISLEDMEILVEENEELVSKEILQEIPCFPELFDYIILDNELETKESNQANLSPEKKKETILHNVVIQVANGIVALILNYFSNNEKVKKNLYNIDMASSREIAKFRNRLAWEYRKKEYWQEPKNIFESQYRLFFFTEKGIDCTFVYYPRQQELESLRGLRWAVTILLEIRDAIAPLLRSLVGTVGTTLVYILTQVIGRAIGLVGKGILQGIGNSLSERDYPSKPKKQNSKS